MRSALFAFSLLFLAGCAMISPERRAAAADYQHAVALYRKGDLSDSMFAAHQALTHDPGSIPTHWLLATIHLKLGEWRAAIGELTHLIEHHPHWIHAGNRIAEILVRHGYVDEAKKYYLACIHTVPNYLPSLVELGMLEIQTGHPAEAKKYLARAVKDWPRHWNAHVQLAGALLKLGDEKGEQEELEKALHCPDLPAQRRKEILAQLHRGPGTD